MHHREKHGSLHGKLEPPSTKKTGENLRDLELTPQSLKNKGWPQTRRGDHGQLALLLSGEYQGSL